MIVYWKGHVNAKVSPAFVSQLDLFASLGKLVGGEVPESLDSREHRASWPTAAENMH